MMTDTDDNPTMMTYSDTNNPAVEKEEAPVEVTETVEEPPPKSQVSMQRTDSGKVDANIGAFHLEVEAKQVPLVGYLLASFIFMVAALAQRDALEKGWYGYAVTIGVIGMVAALVGLLLLKYKSELDQVYLAYFVFAWAIVGACCMTFGSGPFTTTGNGEL